MEPGELVERAAEWIEKLRLVRDDDLQQLSDDLGVSVHVAIVTPEYIPLIESGRKVVESRLSKNRISPFGRVAEGDLLLLKQTSGPIQLAAMAGFAEYRDAFAPKSLPTVLSAHFDALAYQPGFLESKSDARYVTLIGLSGVRRISTRPMERRRRSGWDVFSPRRLSLL